MSGPLKLGDLIRTGYGTGPYRVFRISDAHPCSCGMKRPHQHLTLVWHDVPVGREREDSLYFINHVERQADGRITSRGGEDEIFIIGAKADVQLDLFGSAA